MDPVEEIKRKIDIVEFILEYLPLKKMGRNFAARCPFHEESKPSFMVSQDRQIFRCFGCLPKGGLVKTKRGLHPIEQVKLGDLVASGKGRLRRVILTHERLFEGKIIEIQVRKLTGKVSLTQDHNVFVIRGAPYTKVFKNFSRRIRRYSDLTQEIYQKKLEKYFPVRKIKAGELRIGDYLLYPIDTSVEELDFLDLEKYVTRKNTPNPMQPREIPLKVPISDDFLKLLGYWITEGSIGSRFVRFSLGPKEKAFADEIRYLLKGIFGLPASLHIRNGKRTGIELSCSNVLLANVFENLCGKGAANKRIPFELERVSPKKQKVIIDALVKGDGRIFTPKLSPNLRYSITTSSQILAEQIRDILLRCNFFPSISVIEAKIDKKGISHKRFFRISWTEKGQSRYKVKIFDKDGFCYWILPIRSLEEKKFKGRVYNLTVAKDHSYVANNFAVANCEAKGDIFAFLELREGLTFPEALEILAKRAGVALPRYDPKKKSEKEKIISINSLAAQFYNFFLLKHKVGEKARVYLKNRGVKKESVEDFQLGYAPKSSILGKFLEKKGFSLSEIAHAGLLVAREGGKYLDRFYDRIIFPIRDLRGQILGFSGRIIELGREKPKETEPKYLNSPETPVFQKGALLFGLDLAKDAIREANQAVLVEGEFDVISSHQAGVKNAVGVKGTALTQDQINLIGRFTENIDICFDTDLAGDAAARRGIELADRTGLNIKVIQTGEFKDPDEMIKKDPKKWKDAVSAAVPVYDWLIQSALLRYDSKDAYGKKKIGQELLPIFTRISDEIVKAHYIDKLAQKLAISPSTLFQAIGRLGQPESRMGKEERSVLPAKVNSREKLCEHFLALILQGHELVEDRKNWPEPKDFPAGALKNLFERIIISSFGKRTNAGKNFRLGDFVKSLEGELVDVADRLILVDMSGTIEDRKLYQAELAKVVSKMRELKIREELLDLSKKIKKIEEERKEKELILLQKKFDRLKVELAQAVKGTQRT